MPGTGFILKIFFILNMVVALSCWQDAVLASAPAGSFPGGSDWIEPGSASVQTIQDNAAKEPGIQVPSEDSTSFLMESDGPVRRSTPLMQHEYHQLIEQFRPNTEQTASLLVSESCTRTSSESGTSSCRWVYSDGSRIFIHNQSSSKANQRILKTEMTEEADDGTLLSQRKIIRTRIYSDGKENSVLEQEHFDIHYEFRDGVRTREVLRYFYHPEPENEKKLRTISWTKYENTSHELPRRMTYHAVLIYDRSEKPLRGFADSWRNGMKATRFLDWERARGGLSQLDRGSWYLWEKWILNSAFHAYLV